MNGILLYLFNENDLLNETMLTFLALETSGRDSGNYLSISNSRIERGSHSNTHTHTHTHTHIYIYIYIHTHTHTHTHTYIYIYIYTHTHTHISYLDINNVIYRLAKDGGTRWRSWLSTALQASRSRVRSAMVSLEFFIGIILPLALWPWGWLRL